MNRPISECQSPSAFGGASPCLATPGSGQSPAKRYHEFDALRGFAMLLGIVLHAALSFTFLPIWVAQDIHQNSTAYGFVLHAIHGFRMPVFFVISGFFTAMMWRKRGAGGLIRHRAKRILLPLVVGTIVLWPLLVAIGHWGEITKQQRRDNATSNSRRTTKEARVGQTRAPVAEEPALPKQLPPGVSPLDWAAMHNRPEIIARLVGSGVDVNARNANGSTPLHAAAFFGRTAAARKLVELGADARAKDGWGNTPLAAARMDMALTHVIAAAAGLRIDGREVAAGKREVGEFLQQTVGESAPVWSDNRAVQLLVAVYLGLTFFPFLGHLWFLYYLLWLVGLFLMAVWLRRLFPRLRAPRWVVATPWCFLWLVPLTLVPQIFMTQTFGADTASGVLPWPPKLAYYAVFFGYGALGFGRPEFERDAGRRWWLLLLAAVPMLLAGVGLYQMRGGNSLAQAGMSFCAVTYAWLMIFGLVGVFRRLFARENSRLRYLSDASYWLYLAHLPLMLSLQVWVSNWDIHHFPKFLLVCTVTVAVLMLMYEYLVRYTFIGAALNGRKTRSAANLCS